jgi:uncharacterized protein (DUF1778 family)
MNDDLISRAAAIDILDAYQVMVENGEENPYAWARLRMSELPPAQPELIEKAAYIRGIEQGRTQGMIDSQCGKKFATDAISRKAAIDALDKRFDKIPMVQTTEILKLRMINENTE